MDRVRGAQRLIATVVALGLATAALADLSGGGAARAASPNVVISQVYGGGGNAGAPYSADFVELFNRGSAAVDLTGWSIQYASATGTGNFAANASQLTELSGSIPAGGHLLIHEASGATGAPLPAADQPLDTTPINLAAGAGKVALVNTTASLGCNGGSAPCSAAALAQLVDLVGYGNANFAEGAPAPTLSNTTAALRAGDGCLDSDDNASDFAAGSPAPRNAAAPLISCDGATATATPTPTVTATPAVSSTATLTPTVTPTATASPTAISIHAVQGASHVSPLVGQALGNVPGIVTARRANGFFMQEPAPDGDDRTSEGIFVFTTAAPAVEVGDAVSVGGTVQEFRPGGATSTNLATTELVTSNAAVSILSRGNPLPAPVTIGPGGRTPPTSVIDDDSPASNPPPNVETSGTFEPADDGIDFYESLEGMLVQVVEPVVVGPTSSFGEVVVLPANGAGAGLRTARGGILLRADDANPERVFLDDEILRERAAAMPAANVGDHFAGAVVGLLDYSFGNFKLQVLAPPTVLPGGLAREKTAAPTAGQLAVATFNVENLDPGDPASKFAELARLIVEDMRSPDLIAVEEIQDNNGPTNDATVDASQTFNKLIQAIQAVPPGPNPLPPTYQFRQIDPVNNQDGGEPGGNIRVGFLFRTDRGLAFVDRPGGTATAPVGVVADADGPRLSLSPGRLDPTNAAFNSSRKPLAGEFTFNGRRLFAIANHFNSKGGDQPLFGPFQPPVRPSEVQRHQQATIVRDFVAQIVAADANARVVVLGDINDFEFSQTITIVKGGVLTDLMETLPLEERYSYVFEGNSQTLDHILASQRLMSPPPQYDVLHVNAEFADQTSDHDPQVARFTIEADTAAPTTSATASPTPNAAGWNKGAVTVTLSASDGPLGVGVQEIVYSLSGAATGGATVPGSTASVAVSAEGTTTLTYFARDRAGNVEPARTLVLRIDTTAPTVSYTGNAGSYTVDQSVAIVCQPADALSGLASNTCAGASGPAYTFALGANTLSATATDLAGNVGTGSTTFTVSVSPASLSRLTLKLIQESARYRALPPGARAAVDRLGAAAIQHLSARWETLTPRQRSQAVAAYQRAVNALAAAGWLTHDQAATLGRLGGAL